MKNANISHISFELYCDSYCYILYKNDIDLNSKSKSGDKIVIKLRNFISLCKISLQYI